MRKLSGMRVLFGWELCLFCNWSQQRLLLCSSACLFWKKWGSEGPLDNAVWGNCIPRELWILTWETVTRPQPLTHSMVCVCVHAHLYIHMCLPEDRLMCFSSGMTYLGFFPCLFYVHVYIRVWAHAFQGTHVEVRGQLA